jgi:hypothetical protein
MYLALATFCYGLLGYPQLIASFTSFKTWEHHVPDVMYGMMYILCVVLCFAVTVMGAWHIYGITSGETSVEGQDNELYRKRAKARDQVGHPFPFGASIYSQLNRTSSTLMIWAERRTYPSSLTSQMAASEFLKIAFQHRSDETQSNLHPFCPFKDYAIYRRTFMGAAAGL